MTSSVSIPADRHRREGDGAPARCGSERGATSAVPDLFGLLEDGPPLLLLADVEQVRVQLLVLVVHLEQGAAVGVHQVFCVDLKMSSGARGGGEKPRAYGQTSQDRGVSINAEINA